MIPYRTDRTDSVHLIVLLNSATKGVKRGFGSPGFWELSFEAPAAEDTTVDDINPASPRIRNIPIIPKV